MWPPVALGGPWLAGLAVTVVIGDPVSLQHPRACVAGWVLFLFFGVWNGWALWLMHTHGTALLPGGSTRVIIDSGPFGLSRNPLDVGLVALDVGISPLWPSFWALVLVPVGVALLWWGAVRPEERYLSAKFGAEYDACRRRVRRWL